MTSIVLPLIYPLAGPIFVYYATKYATTIAINIAIDKTKSVMWYGLTSLNVAVKYPFTTSEKDETPRDNLKETTKEKVD